MAGWAQHITRLTVLEDVGIVPWSRHARHLAPDFLAVRVDEDVVDSEQLARWPHAVVEYAAEAVQLRVVHVQQRHTRARRGQVVGRVRPPAWWGQQSRR